MFLINANTKENAMLLINENLQKISDVAGLILERAGYNYGANAVLRSELFPTRAYDDIVLESGEYDSLIVELGSAEGDNWWCVVYPPLCFVNTADDGSSSVTYRSKLLEIIKSFFGG